jgi:hypothetical protein
MVEHKFSRSGYPDVIFELYKQSYTKKNDVITDKVPKVGARQAPLTTTERLMMVTGTLVKDGSKSAEAKAYDLDAMSDFGAMIDLRIETDVVRTWEGIAESLTFDILAGRTENLLFTMKFKVDDYP